MQKFGETCITGTNAMHTISLQNTQPPISDKPCEVLPHRTSRACNSAESQAAGLSLQMGGEGANCTRPGAHIITPFGVFDASMKTTTTPSRRCMTSGLPGLFIERADVRAWYSGLSGTLPPVRPGEIAQFAVNTATECDPLPIPEETHRRDRIRACFGGNVERVEAVTGINARLPNPVSYRCSDKLYTERELAEMDANMTFVIPSEFRAQEIRQEAVELMASASEAMVPCAICELSCLRSDITAKGLTTEFVAV